MRAAPLIPLLLTLDYYAEGGRIATVACMEPWTARHPLGRVRANPNER